MKILAALLPLVTLALAQQQQQQPHQAGVAPSAAAAPAAPAAGAPQQLQQLQQQPQSHAAGGAPEGAPAGPPAGAPAGVTEVPLQTTTEDTAGRLLKLPVPKKCAARPVHFTHGNHSYFYSDRLPEYNKKKFDWLEGRNECREYCMDLVSIETPAEDDMVREFVKKEDLPYIWTSGRLCNFKGCDREDLQPVVVNGWFWSGSGVKMAPTNATPPGWPYQPWSHTGHKSALQGKLVPQPDNAEFEINESVEACMGVLNDIYEDGIKWHDIACYHTKPFLCEDSEQLLEFARSTNPELNIF